jgi:hypothetical protein
MNRPRGVTVIVVFDFLSAVLHIASIFGVAYLILLALFFMGASRQSFPEAPYWWKISLPFSILAAMNVLIGSGLWRLKEWGRTAQIVLAALNITVSIPLLGILGITRHGTIVGGGTTYLLGTLVVIHTCVEAAIFWYLRKPPVRAAFQQQAHRRPGKDKPLILEAR